MLEFAASLVSPIYWVVRHSDGTVTTRNGTAFFLRTNSALFGVTAAHVIEGPRGWREHCLAHGKTPLRLGARDGASIAFDWDARAVDINLKMDIATFEVSPREIEDIQRSPYAGLQNEWPPDPPNERQGIIYAGFPGVGTRQLSRSVVQFGIVLRHGHCSQHE